MSNDSTGPTGPDNSTGPTGPAYLITMDDLMEIHSVIIQKQVTDASSLQTMFNPAQADLQNNLVGWASQSFPVNYVLTSVQITPPTVCSDGVIRNFLQYILFCMGLTNLADAVATLQSQVLGINVSYTLSDPFTISLVVSKS